MLACEMATAANTCDLSWPGLNSSPIRNMYRITPSCAMIDRYGAASGGNNGDVLCPNQTNSDGPRAIPASTSPMTGGWPTHFSKLAKTRPTSITAASASRTWAKADVAMTYRLCGCQFRLSHLV